MKISWKLAFLLTVIAGVGTWLWVDHRTWGRVENVLKQISGSANADESRPSKAWVSESAKRTPWDDLIMAHPAFRGVIPKCMRGGYNPVLGAGIWRMVSH